MLTPRLHILGTMPPGPVQRLHGSRAGLDHARSVGGIAHAVGVLGDVAEWLVVTLLAHFDETLLDGRPREEFACRETVIAGVGAGRQIEQRVAGLVVAYRSVGGQPAASPTG